MTVFQGRFFWLAGLTMVGVLAGNLVPIYGHLALGALAGLLLLAWLERHLIGGSPSFELERVVGDRLTLGQASRVQLRVRNSGRRDLWLKICDEPEEDLGADSVLFHTHLPPRRTVNLEYQLLPRRRGRLELGPVRVRVGGPLGLLERQLEFPLGRSVKVYPTWAPLQHGLAHRQALQQAGLSRSRVPGQGTDFEHLRDYSHDDDVRSIDWKATARSSRPMVRSYQAERHQSVMLVLDAGRLMAARAGHRPKLEWALEAVCGLAQLVLKQGDQAGLLVYADRVLALVPPRAGLSQLQSLVEAVYNLPVQRCESLHEKAVTQLRRRHSKRSLVALFTDLGDPASARRLVKSLAPLRPNHLPLVLTIRDQELWDTAEQKPGDLTAMFRVGVANELLAEREQALMALRRTGALTVDCAAQDLSLRAVKSYLDIKLRNRL